MKFLRKLFEDNRTGNTPIGLTEEHETSVYRIKNIHNSGIVYTLMLSNQKVSKWT